MVLRAMAWWKAALAGLCLAAAVPALAQDTPAAANYYVKSLPGQPDGPLLRMHAGHIEIVPEHHGKLFFWRYENRHLANRHRTVIWLNGGPGCSSEDGALMEIGPYRLKDSEKLEYNPGAWDEFANLLFVDNPVGTGYSSVDSDSYIHELTTMAENMMAFLEKYFTIFPQEETNDIYIAGESYAGQHIPYIAQAILDRNKNKATVKPWNLKGLLIGNGWISPVDQGPSYLEYMYKNSLVEKGSKIGNELDGLQRICSDEVAQATGEEMRIQYESCETVLTRILELTADRGKNECYNMYDVRLKDELPACGMNWPPDLAYVTPYLQRTDVMEALHVNEDHQPGWRECNSKVSIAFHPQKSKPAIHLLPDILKEVPVLLFSGDKDLICNHMGTEQLIHNMNWNGATGFEISPGTIAPRKDWVFEGEAAGIYQEARNLTYVLFYNSSHMVPFDYPRRTRDMLDRFMGVDIGSVGGKPTESLLDGNKSPSTSVGGHPNSTVAQAEEDKKLEAERWSAYYRSGAVALVVVMILAAIFGWYVWQDRRRRAGYGPVGWMKGPRGMMHGRRPDLEATDFDEGELDDLASPEDRDTEHRYSLGGVSSDDDDDDDLANGKEGAKLNGHTNGVSK